MATRSWVFIVLLTLAVSVLAGCGGGNTANVQNPPPPTAASNVSITFQPAPASEIQVSATTTFAAVVTNDQSNAGVDWSVSCPTPGNCGKLSPIHTASGASTTYTPPSSFPGNSETSNIVAFATADHTQNVRAPISVSAFGSKLNGKYVLQAEGVDSSLGTYQFAAVIVLDGNGGITSGEQTINFTDQNPDIGALVSMSDTIVGGNYFLGGDGRGRITINTNNKDIGANSDGPGNGTETFTMVTLSNSQALIAQVDFNGATTAITARGTMDLQTASTAPTGSYAFVVNGFDIANQLPAAFGGIINIDSPNTISGTGSQTDQNLGGTIIPRQTLSGTVSDPDAFGVVTLDLNAGFAFAPIQFKGYMVDGAHIKLIESDNTIGGNDVGATGGLAIAQGVTPGSFDATSFSGSYVFGVQGTDVSIGSAATLASAGVFSADGAGGITSGYTDTTMQGAFAQISASFNGVYVLDARGIGRVQTIFRQFTPRPNPIYVPTFIFYLTGNGNPVLVLHSGGVNYPAVGTGVAYPQSAGALKLDGNYGFSFTQQSGLENDGTGQMTANASAQTVSGIADINAGFSASFDTAFADTVGTPDASGRLSGTLFNSTAKVDYYMIDSTHGFVVETDLVDPGTGQVSLGYYAARTPICAGCP